MILTGKCKEDFYAYITKGMSNFAHDMEIEFFNQKSNVEKNALIIEFFDSVGIYIEINVNQITDKNKNITKCNFDSAIFHVKHRTKEGRTLTQLNINTSRQEATTEAIKKANEIYNNR